MRNQKKFIILLLTLLSVVLIVTSRYDAIGSSPDVWTTKNAEGLKAYQQQHYEQAIQLFHEAISSLKPYTEPRSQEAITLNNLAAAYEGLNRFDEAELHYLQSMTIVERIQGPHHPDLVLALTNLAIFHRKRGRFAQAERLYQRSLTIMERVLGDEHPHLIPVLLDLAHVSQAQNEFERSETYYKRALTIGKTELPVAHHQTQSIRMQYADLLRHLNRVAEANWLEDQARHDLDAPTQSPLIK